MKKVFVVFVFLSFLLSTALRAEQEKISVPYHWLIIGAGPAGIALVGVLCDLGVDPATIVWVDSEFNVGRIGHFYQNVPANNKTGPFIDFINQCAIFNECKAESLAVLRAEDPTQFPHLGIIVPALQDITNFLLEQIPHYRGWLTHLHPLAGDGTLWQANVGNTVIQARNVVLATGSHPRTLDYGYSNIIPLDQALDKNVLASHSTPDETIGVVGSSHSAVLIIKYLYELETDKIINFYRSPLAYTSDMGCWNLNAYNGLKGATAAWAREHLERDPLPQNILRVYNNEENRTRFLPECDKIIYAIGYERNELPLADSDAVTYDEQTGFIAPGLFGIGIAFPEYYCDPLGNEDHRVGLTSFMDYIQRIVPQWVDGLEQVQLRSELYRYRKAVLGQFEQLFIIDVL